LFLYDAGLLASVSRLDEGEQESAQLLDLLDEIAWPLPETQPEYGPQSNCCRE
jgi:hypothetical protein